MFAPQILSLTHEGRGAFGKPRGIHNFQNSPVLYIMIFKPVRKSCINSRYFLGAFIYIILLTAAGELYTHAVVLVR